MRRFFLMLAGALFATPARAQPVIPPALRDWAARALAQSIEAAREQAIADGVRPVPSTIYRGLLGYFPPTLLQRARFGSSGIGRNALPAVAFAYGDAAAVTLGDVILFRNDRAAQTDLKLWAHELTHVMQYQRWGLDGFASRYIEDSGGVEREAYDNASRFARWQGGSLQ